MSAVSIVNAREKSLRTYLSGESRGVSKEQAKQGLATALAAVKGGKPIGFGLVKDLGSPAGTDGIRVEYAVTDGERQATIHAIVPTETLGTLGYDGVAAPVDASLDAWVRTRLYERAGRTTDDGDRYAAVIEAHPIELLTTTRRPPGRP